MKEFKVAIQCLCYNHAPYLKRTLDGISSQQTKFKYLAVIIDDASTDDSQDAILNYANELCDNTTNSYDETDDAVVHMWRHKLNNNFYLAAVFLKYNYYQINKSKTSLIAEWTNKADYWALCECDDYWIYDKKLQEEVDILETDPNIGLIYTDYDIHYYETGTYIHAAFKNGVNPIITSFEQHLVKAAYIAPMSWLCRIPFDELMSGYLGPPSIDMSFIAALEAFLHSRVFYLDKVTCVYGKHSGSATKQVTITKQYDFSHGAYSTQKYYLEKYNLREKYPTCLDYFINAYYSYILAQKITAEYPEVLSFFHRKGKTSFKYKTLDMMMRSKLTLPLLQAICKIRLSRFL